MSTYSGSPKSKRKTCDSFFMDDTSEFKLWLCLLPYYIVLSWQNSISKKSSQGSFYLLKNVTEKSNSDTLTYLFFMDIILVACRQSADFSFNIWAQFWQLALKMAEVDSNVGHTGMVVCVNHDVKQDYQILGNYKWAIPIWIFLLLTLLVYELYGKHQNLILKPLQNIHSE